MKHEELQALKQLKARGYAIVVITPEELLNANPDKVEDRLIDFSWEVISQLNEGD
jgi:Lhr-like helicase